MISGYVGAGDGDTDCKYGRPRQTRVAQPRAEPLANIVPPDLHDSDNRINYSKIMLNPSDNKDFIRKS